MFVIDISFVEKGKLLYNFVFYKEVKVKYYRIFLYSRTHGGLLELKYSKINSKCNILSNMNFVFSSLLKLRQQCKLLIINFSLLWLYNVKYCLCSFAYTCIVMAANRVQIRVRSHQLIKILTGDSYTYELCIWHSIDLYPMFAKLLCVWRLISAYLVCGGTYFKIKEKICVW